MSPLKRTKEPNPLLAQFRKVKSPYCQWIVKVGKPVTLTPNAKTLELRDRAAQLRCLMEASDRSQDEKSDLAVKAFELSQNLADKWLTADFNAKRRIMSILCLNFSLRGVTLVPTMRKPFNLMAEGLFSGENRGGRI